MTGIPAQDQRLHVVTQDGIRPLEDGTKLPDYFPDVRNRSELCMVDSDPERDVRAAQQGALEKKKSMGADSVISMARMFQAVRASNQRLSMYHDARLHLSVSAHCVRAVKTHCTCG
jgi:hypothetical protein